MVIHSISSSAPSSTAEEVTNSDSVDFTNGTCRALYTGAGGDITVIMGDGSEITFNSTIPGTVLPISCKRVKSTGTDPTDTVALF